MSDDGELAAELRARLELLLERAREVGAGGELAPLLAAFLAEHEESARTRTTGDVPGRCGMIGDSPAMCAVFDLIERAAPSDVPVLVRGETGTGKELVARALHQGSPRRRKPFLAENCAAVPANLLESELFGHVRGAFTGAVADYDGHFVAASGGTLFLDELGDMPLEMQAKLLRVLETHEVRPVGSSRMRKVDVRLVAATHQDLETMMAEGRFRQDLAYRLNVLEILLPPLRERAGDVALLARVFLERAAGGKPIELSPAALERLVAYAWPGNVRQLENEIRRAVALSSGIIRPQDLSSDIGGD